ncbi:glycosyltransferase family 4 protein [Methanosarcina sp.]|uniref:glycosyltransferase family 4 protein n=1 Tax=Methanosarcina sp. TaxID=2213 RepID=UPI0029883819|nr:glycosyltransferase family 4 protein [Methanosarcina sp.]MDW5549184.1 glycosyltransferase family 4 protein [Methanosarcina sp.]MDW5553110.1 glycosyltransferase family 4 protein [Methanosarcina sp.]MDW5559364.1 glycosyltransferase family 4 protein [Methanosarcina sp.]
MKILVVSPFSVYPPKSGGTLRINNLNLELSKNDNICLFSQGIRKSELRNIYKKTWVSKINSNYIEYHFVNIPSLVISYILALYIKYPSRIFSGNFLNVDDSSLLYKCMKDADIIQVEHPWQFQFIYNNRPHEIPIILVEHNVEFDLFEQVMNSNSIIMRKLLKICRKKEEFAAKKADAVFAVSKDDAKKLCEEFHISESKVHVIPNGVDTSNFVPYINSEKEKTKKLMNLNEKKIILFTGSRHISNIHAVNNILEISKKIKDKNILFIVAGSVGNSFKNLKNVLFTGYVDDISIYFKVADLAVNPMISGSGTNLKILEYLACGIPTITTKVGARGLEIENEKHVIISEIEDFPEWINILLEDSDLCTKLEVNGRELVIDMYDWKQIAKKEFTVYEKLVDDFKKSYCRK